MKFLQLGSISIVFFNNLALADYNCKEHEPFKLLSTEIIVEDFKFNFVRLTDMNVRGEWQEPGCYESQLFIHNKHEQFDTSNLSLMERTATVVETMKSRKFVLSVLPSDQNSFVIVEGNYGGNQSAFFNLYQIHAGALTRLASESYTGELSAYTNNSALEVTYKKFDYSSPAAISSADTPVIEIEKSYKAP